MILTAASTMSPMKGKPRASGDDPGDGVHLCKDRRVNPARAGMIPAPRTRRSTGPCKPRASGDDPDRLTAPHFDLW